MQEHGRSSHHANASGSLASSVAASSTFTIAYPARLSPEIGVTDAGDFYQGFFHRLVMNGATLVYPDDFDLTFGTSSITVTNRTGGTWPADSKWFAQFDRPGKRVWGDNADGRGQPVNRTARSDAILVNLGAPDTAVSNGICASQSIAAGTNSTATSATLDGTLASTNAVTGLREAVLDVPRNVVAGWTTSAVLTVEGYDEYGNFMVEKSASTTTLTGKKAFKKVTRVWSTVAITSATIGTGDVLGLPFYLPHRRYVTAEIINGDLAGDMEHIYLPFLINATDLAGAVVQQIVSPVAGRVVKASTAVQVTLSTTGNEVGVVTITVNGATITDSSLTSYTSATAGSGSIGDVASVVIPAASSVAAVAAGDVIGIVPSSAWASNGVLSGVVEIAPTGAGLYTSGTFVAGFSGSDGHAATSADVRGTYDPPVAMDGSVVVQLLVSLPDPGNRGTNQFATP